MSHQRDRSGRFLPGHRGGRGRPKGTRNPAYLVMVEDVVGLNDWRAILERIKQSALHGNLDALKFLAGYLLGRPGFVDPPQDETENPNELSSPLAGSPSQLTPAMIKLMDQQLEQQKRRADEAAETRMNKQLAEKKRR